MAKKRFFLGSTTVGEMRRRLAELRRQEKAARRARLSFERLLGHAGFEP